MPCLYKLAHSKRRGRQTLCLKKSVPEMLGSDDVIEQTAPRSLRDEPLKERRLSVNISGHCIIIK